MRLVSVFANGPDTEIELLRAELRGRWRQALRAVMVLLSVQGLPPAQIAGLLECHPATVRRWIGRVSREGLAGLADRPRCGRPPVGGKRLAARITALPERPGPWTLPRIWQYLGRPAISMRTLYRRVRQVAVWRRPKLTARGDPARDHVVAGIVARLMALPRRAVVLAEDETHLNLLPHVRARWTLRGARSRSRHAGEEPAGHGLRGDRDDLRRVGVPAGPPRRRLHCPAAHGRRGVPRAPVVVVICDNDSIHHARAVTRYLETHPRLEVLYGARYSPHDNPAERIWAGLKNYVANTAVTWPGRLKQIHAYFRSRSPDQMLALAAPWTSPWLPAGYEQNFWNGA